MERIGRSKSYKRYDGILLVEYKQILGPFFDFNQTEDPRPDDDEPLVQDDQFFPTSPPRVEVKAPSESPFNDPPTDDVTSKALPEPESPQKRTITGILEKLSVHIAHKVWLRGVGVTYVNFTRPDSILLCSV